MEIIYKGKDISINEDLLNKMDAWGRLPKIMEARIAIIDLFHLAKLVCEHDNCGWTAKGILDRLTELEDDLQEGWGFAKDKKHHTYQWELPGCTCPKLDNYDRAGVGSWIIRGDCPYHGRQEER